MGTANQLCEKSWKHWNQQKLQLRVKIFSFINSRRIPEKYANENIEEEQEDDPRGERLEIDVIKKGDKYDGEKSPYIHRNTDFYPRSVAKSTKSGKALSGAGPTFANSTTIFKGHRESGEELEQTEPISCIFKVFDDIRQDNLALQVIKLFKQIFQSVGLDLYLFPYKTISNRTGPDGDIGGIIEVVPNTISRDQMGKTNDYDLYEYFKNKFGNE